MTSAVNEPAGVSVSPNSKELVTSLSLLNNDNVRGSSDGVWMAPFRTRHFTFRIDLVEGDFPIDFTSLDAGNITVAEYNDRKNVMHLL